jgi:hypothetical protein
MEIGKSRIINRFDQSLPFLIIEPMANMPLGAFAAVFAKALGCECMTPTPK